VSGEYLEAARAALDGGGGLPSRLFWSPVSLATLYRGRVKTWVCGAHPARGLSTLPSCFWPRAVFTAVVSALAEALLRDLADTETCGDGAQASA
jgi:hypothetical protein